MAEKTELNEFLVHGIDSKNRRIYFGVQVDSTDPETTDFSNSSVEIAVRAIHRMEIEAPNKPIELHMNSYGGDPGAMLYLHDVILASPCQIKFYGGGNIMSSATWIMVCCDERYLYPNTTIMVHDGSLELNATNHTDMLIKAKEEKRLQDLLYDIYAANTKMPKEFWQEVCQRDMHITASEAVSLGMADKLIEPKKRGNLRKLRQQTLKKRLEPSEMQTLLSTLYDRINKVNVPAIKMNDPHKEHTDPNVIIDMTPQMETAPVLPGAAGEVLK